LFILRQSDTRFSPSHSFESHECESVVSDLTFRGGDGPYSERPPGLSHGSEMIRVEQKVHYSA